MVADYNICLGTTGWGVWHSPDAGESWTRHRAPFPLNSRIQALVAHPREAQTVLAGGDTGMFISHDGGARWARISAQGELPTIWSLAIDPVDPAILFAGTRPAGVWRSRDGGARWEKLAVNIVQECSIGTPFVTALAVNPEVLLLDEPANGLDIPTVRALRSLLRQMREASVANVAANAKARDGAAVFPATVNIRRAPPAKT